MVRKVRFNGLGEGGVGEKATHVLVDDPTRGFGIFIENMLEAAK